jgi:hypothetical protein
MLGRLGIGAVAAIAALAATAPAAGAGTTLSVDDAWIAEQSGVERVITQPRRQGQIIDGARDHNYQPYLSVLREKGTYRLWYSAKLMPGERLKLGYTTSRDGLRFRRPARMLDVPKGYQYGASIIRDRRGYLMPYYARSATTTADERKGLNFARSPDGLAWKAVFPRPQFQIGEVGLTGAPSDIVSLIRFQGRYLLFVKMNGIGYQGMTPHMPFPGYRRLVGVMQSRDGRHWSAPEPIVAPDALDSGITEFYGLGGVVQRGGLLVGFLRVLRDDLPADPGGPVEGIGYTVLAWSRDGVHWERDRAPFLDRAADPGWDHAMAWADAQIPGRRRTRIYYGGYADGHKSDPLTQRTLGAASIPLDRYVARTGGTLVTHPLRIRNFELNASLSEPATIRFGDRVCEVPGGDYVYREVCEGIRPGRYPLTFSLDGVRLFGFRG